MKVICAIDSFKGSLTSTEAGEAAREGILRAVPDADVRVFSVSDGGEGLTDVIVSSVGGEYRSVDVSDPLGRRITARYAVVNDTTAIIEMAAAAGITLLKESEKDPMHTTTYGVGEMIAHALRSGIRQFVIGLGGSATCDGGAGCLQALGFRLLDRNGDEIGPGASGLSKLVSVDGSGKLEGLSNSVFHIASDVKAPLCGINGAAYVFGPQKGATDSEVGIIDDALKNFSAVTRAAYPDASGSLPGAGAAGGMGFSLVNYLGGRLFSGIDIVMKGLGVYDAIQTADVVVTGEGTLDKKTIMGKVPYGVAMAAKENNVPVIALCGVIMDNCREAESCFTASFPILRRICSRDYAMDRKNAANNMRDTAEQVFSLLNVSDKRSI
ncbi:MAG: glycerate kinase [Oscillospiraceae bacterium]|nr:glycerate kinase [Oscillospiraceae bacterium]